MPVKALNKTTILSKNLFPVVGVGASAGGLEAFKRLIKAIPDNSGMAYILVQHLHPEHSSFLPQILQKETSLPVNEIKDNIRVEADQIYIIPANKMLIASDGILQLSQRPSKEHRNMPIDVFFSSLAEVHQSHAIGIVLSGNGVDGTIGLRNIKKEGGVTLAQDLESAAYDSMPLSAINAEVVDFILAPEKMPQQLLQMDRTLSILKSDEHTTPGQLKELDSFKKILILLRSRNGVDFTYYKQTTVRRRILRRMVILKQERIAGYLEHLEHHKDELDILFQDILIPVTAFFRDSQNFEYLSRNILPDVLKNKSSINPLRIWVAGCSTGKEAYSLGICLHEYLSDKISTIKIQIFATDISETSISKARTGIYNKNELEGVSDVRLQQFFIKTSGGFQIKKPIRDMCVFACHNFLKDPPFAKIDLISCRNVLIYMEPFLQKKALAIFHYALNEKGYLFLGKSETVGSSSEHFLLFAKNEKFYTRKSTPGRYLNVASKYREEKYIDKDHGSQNNGKKGDDFQKNADEILLSRFTPASVIVNDQLDIVQFRGATSEFLEPAPGKASLNLLKMAREGLSFELRNALHKSRSTREPFCKDCIYINNGKRSVSIEVIPLLGTIETHFLVIFKDTVANKPSGIGGRQSLSKNKKDEKDFHIQRLEKDLLQTKEEMSSITEDQEASNEELQSANEELLSGSEELQSLNEELETSKEELQSTNEEMITVNQELFDRNEQLDHARLYAEAIVTTIHEPLLVIGKDFKIISANKSFYKDFKIAEDEATGRVLFDLQNNQWNISGLREQLLRIQTGNERFVEWDTTFKFPMVGERTICFNAQPIQKENGENLILLAFQDITTRIEKNKIEKKIAEDQRKIMENIPQITSTASPDGSATFFNQFFLNYSGMTLTDALGHGWEEIIKPQMKDEFRKLWNYSIATGEDFQMEILVKRKIDNMFRWHVCRASAIRNEEGNITSWVGAATDIHDQKTKEESKDEFISIASHELKTPLTAAKAYIQLLQLSTTNASDDDRIYLQKAGASIDRLSDLIEELLDVSKIQSGNLNMHIAPFNFNEMVSFAIESVQYGSPNHSIIKTGEIHRKVMGDKERLKQVMINLLSNAVKYSPGANNVFVNVIQEKGEIKVSVKDTGIGIRKENLGKIFERYYREENRVAHFQGLGIGLFISAEIIQRHHGKLWVESEADKGSSFYFTLPI